MSSRPARYHEQPDQPGFWPGSGKDRGRSADADRRLFERSLLLINPAAGPWWRRRWIGRVVESLRHRLPTLTVEETPGPGTTSARVRRAAEAGVTLVFAAGGDGTANEVINGLAGTPVPLAALPLGTGNALAREAGLSTHPLKACEQILAGRVARIPLGQGGGRYFALAAGCGFDAYVLRTVSRRAIAGAGSLAYVVASAALVTTYSYPRIVFTADGRRLEGTSGVLFKARIPVGPFDLMPAASLHEPVFHLLVCEAPGPLAYLGYGAALLCGQHLTHAASQVVTSRAVDVQADRAVPIHLDGELAGSLPMRFTIDATTVGLVCRAG